MVSKRQLKQIYPLTERAHIMVSTMIWVGLINPPFEVPLGQKGVPLSVSLDHRFTSLGAATAFILWKKEENQRWEDQAAPVSLPGMEDIGNPRTGVVAIRDMRMPCGSARTWGPGLQSTALNSCSAAESGLMQASQTREGIHGIISILHAGAFSAAAAAWIMCVLLPHLETALPFSPATHCQAATSLLHLSSQRKN